MKNRYQIRTIIGFLKKFRIVMFIFIILSFVWIHGLFISKNNTFIYITNNSNYSDYEDLSKSTDLSLYIDDRLILYDSILGNQEWKFGKEFSVKLSPGKHEIKAISDRFNCELKYNLNVIYSHIIFLGFSTPDLMDPYANIDSTNVFGFYEKFGRKIVIE